MQPKHVKEAFRLLNKSIIRVEQPDVHLEEEDEEEDKQEEMEVEGIQEWQYHYQKTEFFPYGSLQRFSNGSWIQNHHSLV